MSHDERHIKKGTLVRHRSFYRALPKVDLHRHLEGSLRLATMAELARTHDLDLPHADLPALRRLVQVRPDEPHDYRNFLSKFNTLRKFYLSPGIITRLTREAIADAVADNVRYLELRFTPAALGALRGIPPDEVIDLVGDAAAGAEAETGLTTRLIVGVNRHESVALAERTIRAAVDRAGERVVAVDLAGDEVNFSAVPFAGLFREAGEAGLRRTVHAGEWGGAENVIEAIDRLGAERIGHGVRVCEDPAAVRLAAEQGITFEVCPTSNYHSGVYANLQFSPLIRMRADGLKVTLNTDDPGVSDIDLSHEYGHAAEDLGLTPGELKTFTLQAVKSAFLGEAEREQLAGEIERGYQARLQP